MAIRLDPIDRLGMARRSARSSLVRALFLLVAAPPSAAAAQPTVSWPAEPGKRFVVDRWASDLPGARDIALAPDGTAFVGTRKDRVYAAWDGDGDGVADAVKVVLTDLAMPNGVALRDGDLYVAEVNRILRFPKASERVRRGKSLGEPVVVSDAFPSDRHHGWKHIGFGPDGKLYVPVGAPCNICAPKLPYAALHRMNPDGSGLEVVARGIRNSVGFDWNPRTGALWFSDNGRDWMGDDEPPCELNRMAKKGMHFGYPYCHGGEILDPEFGEGHRCADYAAPAKALRAHVAPVGVHFVQHAKLPAALAGQILVAEHGSWNRSKKSGYRVMAALVDEAGRVRAYRPFLEGFLDSPTQTVHGRPVAFAETAEGALLVSDDHAGLIHRVRYLDAE